MRMLLLLPLLVGCASSGKTIATGRVMHVMQFPYSPKIGLPASTAIELDNQTIYGVRYAAWIRSNMLVRIVSRGSHTEVVKQ